MQLKVPGGMYKVGAPFGDICFCVPWIALREMPCILRAIPWSVGEPRTRRNLGRLVQMCEGKSVRCPTPLCNGRPTACMVWHDRRGSACPVLEWLASFRAPGAFGCTVVWRGLFFGESSFPLCSARGAGGQMYKWGGQSGGPRRPRQYSSAAPVEAVRGALQEALQVAVQVAPVFVRASEPLLWCPRISESNLQPPWPHLHLPPSSQKPC